MKATISALILGVVLVGCSREPSKIEMLLENVQHASQRLHQEVLLFNKRCFDPPLDGCQLAMDRVDVGWLHVRKQLSGEETAPKGAEAMTGKDGMVYWVWYSWGLPHELGQPDKKGGK